MTFGCLVCILPLPPLYILNFSLVAQVTEFFTGSPLFYRKVFPEFGIDDENAGLLWQMMSVTDEVVKDETLVWCNNARKYLEHGEGTLVIGGC
jgi:hypothetical protein